MPSRGLLGVDHTVLAELAMAADARRRGLVLVPYLEGERTPNLPDATGSIHGLTLASATREDLARAAVEGLLCGLADGMAAVAATGVEPQRVLLVGGAAASEAVRTSAPQVLGLPVDVPPPGEYVADGAARQAAWALSGGDGPPSWTHLSTRRYAADPVPEIRERYREGREHPPLPATLTAACRPARRRSRRGWTQNGHGS